MLRLRVMKPSILTILMETFFTASRYLSTLIIVVCALLRRMYEYRKELCEKLNLKAIMFGGRIPNYHKYADKMRPKEYIEHVRNREIYDPVLTFQLSMISTCAA